MPQPRYTAIVNRSQAAHRLPPNRTPVGSAPAIGDATHRAEPRGEAESRRAERRTAQIADVDARSATGASPRVDPAESA